MLLGKLLKLKNYALTSVFQPGKWLFKPGVALSKSAAPESKKKKDGRHILLRSKTACFERESIIASFRDTQAN